MAKGSVIQIETEREGAAEVYPDDLQPALQETLAILADIEFTYQRERDRLAVWDGPEDARAEFAAEIERRYRSEREPYLRLLEHLHRRAMAFIGLDARLH